jgi:hypothetical protein
MDLSTITFLGGIISCIIGIATFITGMNARAQKEGVLEQKINQAIEGIEEIKKELKTTSTGQNTLALLVQSHEEKIKTLFRQFNSIDQRQGTLDMRLSSSDQVSHSLETILHHIEREKE